MSRYRRLMFRAMTLISMISLSLVVVYSVRLRDFQVLSLLAMGIAVLCAWGVLFREYKKIPLDADEQLYRQAVGNISSLVLFVNLAVQAGISLWRFH